MPVRGGLISAGAEYVPLVDGMIFSTASTVATDSYGALDEY